MSSIIGWTELQAFLDAPDKDQTLAMQLAESGTAFVQEITGRNFGAKASVVAYVDGLGSRSIWLPDPPVIPTAGGTLADSVTVEKETGTAWETVTATDYRINGRELLLTSTTATWDRGRQNYRVTYTRGYAAGAEPELARRAVLLWVHRGYTGRDTAGLRSESIGSGAYSYTATDGDIEGETLDDLISLLRGQPAIA